jgi:hypothetical protein
MNGLMGDLVGVVDGEAAKAEKLKRHNTTIMMRKAEHDRKAAAIHSLPTKPQAFISFDDDN